MVSWWHLTTLMHWDALVVGSKPRPPARYVPSVDTPIGTLIGGSVESNLRREKGNYSPVSGKL